MGSVFVVVGSDTEVGKTFVSCGILRALRQRDIPVRGLKPIESGIRVLDPREEDGALLAEAAGQHTPTRAFIRLQEPVAPPVAADLESHVIHWDTLLTELRDGFVSPGVNLVEGAGGLLSPLTWQKTAVDLAHGLQAPLVLVVADRLGAVHHTRVCLKAAHASGCTVASVILSAGKEGDETTGKNRDALLRCPEWQSAHAPFLMNLPSTSGPSDVGMWDAWIQGMNL